MTRTTLVLVSGLVLAGCGGASKPDYVRTPSAAATTTGGSTTPGGSTAPGSVAMVVTRSGNGTGAVLVSPASGTGRWASGTTVTLTATPAPDSVFVGWSGDLSGTTNPTSVRLTRDTRAVAVFEVVAAGAPRTSFSVSPDPPSGPAPLTVRFVDTSTNQPISLAWDFGDGQTGTGGSPSHTYTRPGTYTVTLTARNVVGTGVPAVRRDLVVVVDQSAGSRFWYEGDTYGRPFKTHTAGEASLAAEVLTLVNAERSRAGLAPVQADAQAQKAAKAHSEDMSGRGFFDHVTPEGWDPGTRLRMTGAGGYSGYGENIAFGQRSAQEVMTAWMNSTGHRANILSPQFTHLGVGVDEDGFYWTQVFLTR